MRLTVLSIGYPLACVSERTAGGAEQILSLIDEQLVCSGHRSIVIAPEGSQIRGLLLPTRAPGARLDDEQHAISVGHYRAAIREALARFSVDVVHMHGVDFLDYLPESGPPVLVTLHLPPAWYPREAFQIIRPDTQLICVSQSQARECPSGAKIRTVISNGIRLQQFRPRRHKYNYVVALGRVCPEKGFHLALEAAERCGIPLLLAGKVFGYRSHEKYFDEEIRPRLVHGNRFLGEIGPARRNRLLAGARCLMVSSLVSETSSLAAMEAMASGTPVVAYPQGALIELIDHGRTGFLVNTVEEMTEAIQAARELNSSTCRQEAEARFSADRMFEQYLFLYHEAASARPMRQIQLVLNRQEAVS